MSVKGLVGADGGAFAYRNVDHDGPGLVGGLSAGVSGDRRADARARGGIGVPSDHGE